MVKIRLLNKGDWLELYQLITSVDKTLVGMQSNVEDLVEDWILGLEEGIWEVYVAVKEKNDKYKPHRSFFQKLFGLKSKNSRKGSIIGVVTLYADWEEDPELKENEFDIGITVANNYQRKGLGTELMKYIIKRGKHLGLEKACLWTRQDNKGMKKLAHKLRFLENGEKQKNGFKWIRFVKELSQNKKEKNEKKQMDSSILLQYQ